LVSETWSNRYRRRRRNVKQPQQFTLKQVGVLQETWSIHNSSLSNKLACFKTAVI